MFIGYAPSSSVLNDPVNVSTDEILTRFPPARAKHSHPIRACFRGSAREIIPRVILRRSARCSPMSTGSYRPPWTERLRRGTYGAGNSCFRYMGTREAYARCSLIESILSQTVGQQSVSKTDDYVALLLLPVVFAGFFSSREDFIGPAFPFFCVVHDWTCNLDNGPNKRVLACLCLVCRCAFRCLIFGACDGCLPPAEGKVVVPRIDLLMGGCACYRMLRTRMAYSSSYFSPTDQQSMAPRWE